MEKVITGLVLAGMGSIFLWELVVIWQHGGICHHEDNRVILDIENGLIAVLIVFALIMTVLELRELDRKAKEGR